MRSPKQTSHRTRDWYRYYAGYTAEFVEDALDALSLPAGATVLDPWNGSGTTTFVAHHRGFEAIGIDANPVLVLIARSRLLGAEVVDSLLPLAEEILDQGRLPPPYSRLEADPLELWFGAVSAQRVRRVEAGIQHVLIERARYQSLTTSSALEGVSALAAFFYVALFEAVRSALTLLVGSNPTWVRIPTPADRIALTQGELNERFFAAVTRLAEHVGRHRSGHAAGVTKTVLQGNSTRLPLSHGSVDGVITSPPYCTRIDYIVATRPELAVLGASDDVVRLLRSEMLGTPTIRRHTPAEVSDWGPTATSLLAFVRSHSSHASGTYYRKQFTQYLDSLWRSFVDLRRVLKPGGRAVLVVQDSYYKELRIDLAQIVQEMALAVGWSSAQQSDYAIARTKALIHPGARTWRRAMRATESVVLLG